MLPLLSLLLVACDFAVPPMTRLPPEPPDNLGHAAVSILEPEVPAGCMIEIWM
jgi:hypothetical protein